MDETVSIARLYVLRGLYLLNFLLVGWGALSLLSLLGIRYPISMIPILLLQLCYKALWFPLAYFPLRAAGRSSDLEPGFLVAIALDLIVIPWPYVLANYLKKPGDRWKQSRNVTSAVSRG